MYIIAKVDENVIISKQSHGKTIVYTLYTIVIVYTYNMHIYRHLNRFSVIAPIDLTQRLGGEEKGTVSVYRGAELSVYVYSRSETRFF